MESQNKGALVVLNTIHNHDPYGFCLRRLRMSLTLSHSDVGNNVDPWRITLFGDTFQGEEDARIVAQWQGLTNWIRSVPRRAHACSGDAQFHALVLPLDIKNCC